MSELVRYNEERKIPVVDSRLAAGVLGIEHKSLKNLIREYTVDFESFGQLPLDKAVETGVPNPETFYLLNEEQTNLVIAYVQNTPQARQAKMRLIREFKLMREMIDRMKDSVLSKFSTEFQSFLSSYYEQINWAFSHTYRFEDAIENLERYSALEARLQKIETTFDKPQVLDASNAVGS